MAISLSEDIISLPAASHELPNRPHASTMWRFAKRKQLETIRIGGRVFTSKQAVHRMLAAMNGPSLEPSSAMTDKRRREIDAARSRVKARGIA